MAQIYLLWSIDIRLRALEWQQILEQLQNSKSRVRAASILNLPLKYK